MSHRNLIRIKKIYIFQTPESKKQGLIKIGDAFNPDARIREQLNTASTVDASQLEYDKLYECEAVTQSGQEFRDHEIHAILERKGYSRHQITSENETLKGKTEWFKVDAEKAIYLIDQYKKGKKVEEIDIDRFQSFPMRPEQEAAVEQTIKYFDSNKDKPAVEVLWNAKMRFGKTFTAYQLARRSGFSKVLVLTYKPAVEDAWQKDLENHVDFAEYVFLKRESLKEINSYLEKGTKVVAFASYQDLLGTKDEDTEIKDKHQELFSAEWDLVIIDEFHYGTGTEKAKELLVEHANSKAERNSLINEFYSEEGEEIEGENQSEKIFDVVKKISSKYHLYLSGTPFRAIADCRFEQEAIFNWTYTDEQKAKERWDLFYPQDKDSNPYRSLPKIQMYLYKVSEDLIKAGIEEGKDEFSLNFFFKTKNRKFINQEAVKKWLDLISGAIRPYKEISDELLEEETGTAQSQYPFDNEGALVNELDHTLWYLNRVDSAYALRDMLKEHAIFKHYHIILAAGKEIKTGVEAVQQVIDAIDQNKRTITITVGKLTTGVSIPKWKGVLFLRDTNSPENYFQTAFRAQTPFKEKSTGKIKEFCYIFDFSPNRSLKLLTSYSEKLGSDSKLSTSEEKISEFIKYLPVLKVQGNEMVSMDAQDVLTFDLSGTDAKGLGERFVDTKNIVVSRHVIDAIGSDLKNKEKCQEIFDKIKKFRKFMGVSSEEEKKADAIVANLDSNNGKIKNLETKLQTDPSQKKESKEELEKAEKELKSERDKVRELLKTLLSRIPIFMYLTDATEENLEQVLVETKHNLFEKTTGITLGDFKFLRERGLIRIDSIDGYILKFLQLENQNYELSNSFK